MIIRAYMANFGGQRFEIQPQAFGKHLTSLKVKNSRLASNREINQHLGNILTLGALKPTTWRVKVLTTEFVVRLSSRADNPEGPFAVQLIMSFVNGVIVQSAVTCEEDVFPQKHSVAKGNDNFSLQRLRDLVVQCTRKDSGETDMLMFLEMFREILKFMSSLGRLYAFAATDIRQKIKFLSELRDRDGDNYGTVERMVEYECFGKAPKNKQEGTLSFLWLHRAMEFVVSFIEAMRANILLFHEHRFDSDEIGAGISDEQRELWVDKNTQEIVWDVYARTLGMHHGWIVKQLVHVASFASPSRDQMIKIFGGDSKLNLLRLNDWGITIIETGRKNFEALDDYLNSKGVRLLY